MKRKSIKNEVRDFLFQSFYSVVLAEGISILLSYKGYEYNPLPPAVLAVSFVSLQKLGAFNRRPQPGISFGLKPTNRPGVLASAVRWSTGGLYDSRRANDDIPRGYKIRYDEPVSNQLYWDVQLGNRLQPVRVFEDDLHRFISKVSKRQRNGLPPFSRNYFKRQWAEPEYNAMMQILLSCDLVYNRGQGASGKLSVLTPYAAIWAVKNTYTALLQ